MAVKVKIMVMEKFMQIALAEAKVAFAKDEVPVGAIVVYNNSVIGKGHNLRESTNDPTNHAEIIAIKEATRKLSTWRLDECEIYVTKEPCPMCAGAIFQSRINKLIYGVKDEKAGYAGTLHNTLDDKRLNWQTEVISGIFDKQCAKLLKDFFKQKRNKLTKNDTK